VGSTRTVRKPRPRRIAKSPSRQSIRMRERIGRPAPSDWRFGDLATAARRRGARSALWFGLGCEVRLRTSPRASRAPWRSLFVRLGFALFAQVNPKSPTACGPAMVPDPGAFVCATNSMNALTPAFALLRGGGDARSLCKHADVLLHPAPCPLPSKGRGKEKRITLDRVSRVWIARLATRPPMRETKALSLSSAGVGLITFVFLYRRLFSAL